VYWQDEKHRGVMPHNADTAIKVATSAGAIFGQCIFGYLGDALGRKKMYGVELMIIISSTLAQSLCGESTTLSIVGVLIFYRVVMGIGVGGDCKYLVSEKKHSLKASQTILRQTSVFTTPLHGM
jgi:PHS family inorganic phosphate transporter-like MFS transporter